MTASIKQVASQYNFFLCVECGKCVAVCPMSEIFDDFSYDISPRGIIGSILAGDGIEALKAERFWFCLTCDLCTNLCPMGVRFRDFVEEVRLAAIESGITEHSLFCNNCGKYLWPRHTLEYLNQMLGTAANETLSLCSNCRQYDFANKMKKLEPGNRKAYYPGKSTGENS